MHTCTISCHDSSLRKLAKFQEVFLCKGKIYDIPALINLATYTYTLGIDSKSEERREEERKGKELSKKRKEKPKRAFGVRQIVL